MELRNRCQHFLGKSQQFIDHTITVTCTPEVNFKSPIHLSPKRRLKMSETEHSTVGLATKVIHLYFSKCLVVISVGEVHRRGCQSCGFGWEVHDFDADCNVFCTVLTLHKDVFCRSNSQHIRSRQHLTTTQTQKYKYSGVNVQKRFEYGALLGPGRCWL